MKVIDASFDRISETAFRAMAQDGVSGFVQCLVAAVSGGLKVPPVAYDNLVAAKAARLGLAGYCALSPSVSGITTIELGYNHAAGPLWAELAFVEVDVELPGLLLGQVVNAVERVEYLYQRPIIYTSWNTWLNYLGNTDALAHLSLHDANWDGAADLNYPRPYGGWTKIVGKQYAGDVSYHGVQVDLNVFDPEIWRKDMPDELDAFVRWYFRALFDYSKATPGQNIPDAVAIWNSLTSLSNVPPDAYVSLEEIERRLKAAGVALQGQG